MSAEASLPRAISGSGILLALCAFAGMALMTVTYLHSRDYIEANERDVLLQNIAEVLIPGSFNNDVINDHIDITDQEWLGSKNPQTIYRARMNGTPVAAVLSVVAPDGYSGPILLTIGIGNDNQIIGVRVTSHRETPGLGDAIETRKSDWIYAFNGMGLNNTSSAGWKVKKDGGVIDQLTGATITPRAIVKAVHRCLQFYVNNKNRIYDNSDNNTNSTNSTNNASTDINGKTESSAQPGELM